MILFSTAVSPHKLLSLFFLNPLSALRCPQASPFTKPETTPPLRVKILTFYCKYSFLSLEAYALSGIYLHKMVMFKSVTLDAV